MNALSWRLPFYIVSASAVCLTGTVAPAQVKAPQAPASAIIPADGDVPAKSVFTPPAPNACSSSHDQFYGTEPGVYVYWALCEPGKNASFYDYVGEFDLNRGHGAWGSGEINSVLPGPVDDGEPGEEAGNSSTFAEAQNIPLNNHAGTLAAWVRTDPQGGTLATALFLGAVKAKSAISLSTSSKGDQVCFAGVFVDAAGQRATAVDKCLSEAQRWHRVVLTWSDTSFALYVNGQHMAEGKRTGALDNTLFFYRIFPGFGGPGKHMALAKVLVANRTWNDAEAAADFKPVVPAPPEGGLLVTTKKLGTIHEDVLGYQDNNAKISDPQVTDAMLKGLRAAGVRAVRYANGAMGIDADMADWRGESSCKAMGVTAAAPHLRTDNTIDNYFRSIIKPLDLHVGYTVNYGSNPPECTAGGDPEVNGAALVRSANREKHLGIRYWEIGNEQYNGGGSGELDLHSPGGDGATYAQHEAAFYKAIKREDSTALVGVPVGLGVFSWETKWTFPVLDSALYDAVVFHSYPMRDPISDGATLYTDRVASNMHRVHGSLLHLQTMMLNAGKDPSNIWVTEWDGDVGGGKWSRQSLGAVMPMFAAMQLGEFMQAGAPVANWLEQGSSDGCYYYNFDGSATSAYSWVGCGGTFLTYTGPVQGEVKVGFKPGDLSPPAHALQLLSGSGFVQEGEHMLRVFPDVRKAPWLAAYAGTHKGSYAVILINRDRDQAHRVPVALEGQHSGPGVRQWTYGRAQYDGARTGDWSLPPVTGNHGPWSGTYMADLPPWSVNVLVFGATGTPERQPPTRR